jgi:hypothetical protein
MLKSLLFRTVLAVAAFVVVPGVAAAVEIADVQIASTTNVAGKALKLNGAGIRKKVFIKVYVGALYVEETSSDASTLINADKVKMVEMHFLRDVEKDKILGAYKEGFEHNSASQLAELQSGLDRLSAGLADVKEGGVMTVTYVPGKGTTVAIQGGPSVTVAGKTFADALFRNWLGGEPADSGLKEGMLTGH